MGFIKRLLNKLLRLAYFKDDAPEPENNVKRSWKRKLLRFSLKNFPRKMMTNSPVKNEQQRSPVLNNPDSSETSSPINNENRESGTKLQCLKEMQSSWAILVAVITVLGAMSLLFILHQEQILPVFMYTVDQPILLVTVALLSFASTLFLAAIINIHLFSLYDYLNGKSVKLFTSFSVFFIGFLSSLFFYLILYYEFYLWSVLSLFLMLPFVFHLYTKYGSSIFVGLVLVAFTSWMPIAIIYFSVTTSPWFQEAFKEEWIAFLATALIYAYLVVVSMLIFDREKAFRVFLVITIVIILFLNAQIWRLASTYSGIKSQNTCYYLDDKTKYESETLFRFGKVWVSCNGELETFDEKIDTCLIIKDGKVQEQFTRVLPIK